MDGEELGLIDGSGTGDEGGGGGDGGELVETEESFVEGEETPGESEGGGEGGEEEDLSAAGGRQIVKLEPLAIRKALRETLTTNPELTKKFPTLEKAVTTALFKSGQIDKLGGLQNITQALEAVELHGGVDGITELVDELEEHRALEKGFEQGDPKIIDGWAADYPNGFKKLVLPALEKLATLDKEHSDAIVSYVTNEAFERLGVYSVIAALGEALQTLEAGKDGGAIKQFNLLATFIGKMKGLAANAKSGRADSNSELTSEREELAKTKRDMVYSSARADVNPKITYEMNRLIRLALPRGTKVKVEQANRLRREIQAETRARMNSEPDFARNLEDLLKAGNADRLSKFIYTRATRHLGKVVRQLLNEFGLMKRANGSQDTQRRNAGGGSGANGAGDRARVVAGRPKTADIDFTKTDKAVWLSTMNSHGTAWLLSGKQAKW